MVEGPLMATTPQSLKCSRCGRSTSHAQDRLLEDYGVCSSCVRFVEEHPVKSDTHVWSLGLQAEYDRLHHRGRTMYDQLRTQLGWDHAQALELAEARHGRKK